jgi:hypothetical protein
MKPHKNGAAVFAESVLASARRQAWHHSDDLSTGTRPGDLVSTEPGGFGSRATANRLRTLAPVLWVSFLTVVVVGPWLSTGYIFGTDFAGPRHYAFPNFPTSYAALQAALALAAAALPADVVGKVLIVSIFLTAGLGAYFAVPAGPFIARAAAALVYMINPFVYDRLAYGQLTVLAGYAVVPFVAFALRRLILAPDVRRALVAAGMLALVGILDIHMALIAAVLSGVLVGTFLALEREIRDRATRLGAYLLLAVVAALGASSYWLIPMLSGNGPESQTLARIGDADLSAFSTTADPSLGVLVNVLGLYGFWAEDTERFASMKEFVVAWPVILAVILGLVSVGVVGGWKRIDSVDSDHTRPWVLGMVVALVLAVILGIGIADAHVAPVIHWLDAVFPPYRGMRDAGKWGAIVALAYSQLIALGFVAIRHAMRAWLRSAGNQEVAVSLLVAVVLAFPLYYGNGLLYGMHGQIHPSAYPAGWYAADRAMASDPHPGRAVFLPWHGYLALSFVQNSNRVVANPAPDFFSTPVVASEDLEIPGIKAPTGVDQIMLSDLVAKAGQGNWSSQLAAREFKYVLLAREVDWQSYDYLDRQPDLVLVKDYGSIELYRNMQWHS